MARVYEAPKETKAVKRLRAQARKHARFGELVCGIAQLMDDCCASANMTRKALALAIFERGWANYRLQQGTAATPIAEEIIEEEEDTDEEGVV